MMSSKWFSKFSSYLSTMTGRPATFVVAVALVIVWAITGEDAGKNRRSNEQRPHAVKTEERIDKAVENTFPASNPPSTSGTTKIGPGHPHFRQQKNHRPNFPASRSQGFRFRTRR